jgi:hypothetical protein
MVKATLPGVNEAGEQGALMKRRAPILEDEGEIEKAAL